MPRSIEDIQNDIDYVQNAINDIKQRKANAGQFTDQQIAEMYTYSPEAAQFFANKQANEAAMKSRENIYSSKSNGIYTPEQKQLIDAKNQNRLQMQKAQSAMNAALTNKDDAGYYRWKSQVDKLQEYDNSINKKLVDTGLSMYDINTGVNTSTVAQSSDNQQPKSKYETAQDKIKEALDVNDNGYTTNSKKELAIQALDNYNASLGSFRLDDNDYKALKNQIDSTPVPVSSESRITKFVNDALNTVKIGKIYNDITSVRKELSGLKNQLEDDVSTGPLSINMAPLKQAMGALSEGEYGLANTQASALLSNIPFIGRTIATYNANKRFNDKDEAVKSINSLIRSLNDQISEFTPDAIAETFGYNGNNFNDSNNEIFNRVIKGNGEISPLLNLKPMAEYSGKTSSVNKAAPAKKIHIIGWK